jgi:predicted Zn-dependent protease
VPPGIEAATVVDMSGRRTISAGRRRTSCTATLAALGAAGLLSLETACAVNPVTGERELSLISESQEVQLGREAAQEVQQSIGLVDDRELQDYVHRIGTTLAGTSERPALPWTFRVVDDPTPNAFALPGGFIFVTRGLLNLMDSEAELASVLGHEIGHVTARHSVNQISQQQLAQLGLGLGGILFPEIQPFGQALGAGLQLLFLKHGRDDERQADELGFGYASTQGYDLREMADVFQALQRYGDRKERSALPSWLATHPAPEERVEAARLRLEKMGPPPPNARLGRPEYLGQIDGLVFGDDPRQGFFQRNVFYHPDLRFQMRVPEGWQTANLPRAVVAASPQGNAVAQLTLAGQLAPAQAAQQFVSGSGVRVLRSTRETINGIPAVVTAFDAQTQQGAVAGFVAHLSYGDRTYQILTYSGASVFEQAQPIFTAIIGSFAPLTDRAILDVQPARIDIVRLPRDVSLEAFQQTHPSSIPLDLLAIINQVPSPAATMPAGTPVKRVVGSTPITSSAPAASKSGTPADVRSSTRATDPPAAAEGARPWG